MTGVEYVLLHVQNPILYIIRKQYRHSPTQGWFQTLWLTEGNSTENTENKFLFKLMALIQPLPRKCVRGEAGCIRMMLPYSLHICSSILSELSNDRFVIVVKARITG